MHQPMLFFPLWFGRETIQSSRQIETLILLQQLEKDLRKSETLYQKSIQREEILLFFPIPPPLLQRIQEKKTVNGVKSAEDNDKKLQSEKSNSSHPSIYSDSDDSDSEEEDLKEEKKEEPKEEPKVKPIAWKSFKPSQPSFFVASSRSQQVNLSPRGEKTEEKGGDQIEEKKENEEEAAKPSFLSKFSHLNVSSNKRFSLGLHKNEEERAKIEEERRKMEEEIKRREEEKRKSSADRIVKKWKDYTATKKDRADYQIQLKKFRRRMTAVTEILTTEKSYASSIHLIRDIFLNPLKEAKIITKENIVAIFSDIEIILGYNDAFLAKLVSAINDAKVASTIRLGPIFAEMGSFLLLYSPYINNYNSAIETFSKLKSTNKAFAKWIKEMEEKANSNLPSLLIMPIQRIPRYSMLLQSVIKESPSDHPDLGQLEKALTKINQIANIINQNIKSAEESQKLITLQGSIKGLNKSLVLPSRKLLSKSDIQISHPGNSNHLEPISLFTLSDILLWCTSQSSKSGDKYQFERVDYISDISVNQTSPTTVTVVCNLFPDTQITFATKEELNNWNSSVQTTTATTNPNTKKLERSRSFDELSLADGGKAAILWSNKLSGGKKQTTLLSSSFSKDEEEGEEQNNNETDAAVRSKAVENSEPVSKREILKNPKKKGLLSGIRKTLEPSSHSAKSDPLSPTTLRKVEHTSQPSSPIPSSAPSSPLLSSSTTDLKESVAASVAPTVQEVDLVDSKPEEKPVESSLPAAKVEDEKTEEKIEEKKEESKEEKKVEEKEEKKEEPKEEKIEAIPDAVGKEKVEEQRPSPSTTESTTPVPTSPSVAKPTLSFNLRTSEGGLSSDEEKTPTSPSLSKKSARKLLSDMKKEEKERAKEEKSIAKDAKQNKRKSLFVGGWKALSTSSDKLKNKIKDRKSVDIEKRDSESPQNSPREEASSSPTNPTSPKKERKEKEKSPPVSPRENNKKEKKEKKTK
eukprot:TRINITY_DN4341_c0_g2_i3.p1 TRINITY_DN4341_c0_g2~~TRINITY_DN4341_c0_g2_i3.p1  ORF type:complete len:976 (-),score=437.70 TRINITY_DN4341_c0_g2_i3:39-2966(-)